MVPKDLRGERAKHMCAIDFEAVLPKADPQGVEWRPENTGSSKGGVILGLAWQTGRKSSQYVQVPGLDVESGVTSHSGLVRLIDTREHES